MKKIGKKRAILMLSAFVVAFIVAMSLLWTPQVSCSFDADTFEAKTILEITDIDAEVNCEVDEAGNVEVLSGDPHIIFNDLSETSRVVKIIFSEPIEEDTTIEVFVNEGVGFNEGQKAIFDCKEGDTVAYVLLGDYSYIQFRLDVNIDYQLERIELGNAELVEKNLTDRPLWPLCAVVAGVLASIAMYFLDEKNNVVDKVQESFIQFRIRFWRCCLQLVGIGVVSVFLSLLWKGRPSLELYSIYMFLIRTAFIFFVLCTIACLWHYRKTLVENIERAFVQLLLLAGFAMILFTPLAHASWDTETHYRLALETSYLGDVHWTQSDLFVINLGSASMIKGDPYEHFLNMGVLTVSHQDVVNSYEGEISIAHLPAGLFLALGRLIGLPYMFLFMFGKVANLLVYTTLCYFAMKKLRHGKMIVALIALLPTNIFLACNYSYDYWVTGFSILGISYFVGELQDRTKKISTKDTIIMCAALGVACLPKLIYFPILLVPFLMPKDKIEDRKKYYSICCMIFVVLLALFFARSFTETTGEGDTRGGAVGPSEQIAYIFSDVFNYAGILLRFLFTQYLTIANMDSYISHFAYLGINTGRGIIFVLYAVFLMFFDKDEVYDKLTRTNWLTKIYVVLMYFGGSALVATALYVAYTPVGTDTVLGCQARYIMPWLYPLFSVLSMNGIKPIVSKKVLYWGTILGSFGFIYYDLFTIFLPSVINV